MPGALTDSPFGVATRTVRCPGWAELAMVTVAVNCVPSLETLRFEAAIALSA